MIGSVPLSMPSPADDSVSQSNINQNNNQGNVRQGGDGLVGLPPAFSGAALRVNPPSSSEPTFSANSLASQFPFSMTEQPRNLFNEQLLMIAQRQQLQRQMQGPQAPFAPLNMLSVNAPPPVPESFLFEMASRARADSFHSLINSPATSKMSDMSQEGQRGSTPIKDKESPAEHSTLPLLQNINPDFLQRSADPLLNLDRDDHEVSQITSGEQQQLEPTNTDSFLAERKRHASAPDKLPDSKTWSQFLPGKTLCSLW